MKRKADNRFLLASLVGALMVIMAFPALGAAGQPSNPEGWLDKLTGFVLVVKGVEKEGNFDPVLEQLGTMRTVFKKEWSQGDLQGTYAAMTRLMGMLHAREGGIRPEAAKAIWEFCYQVAPIALHYETPYPREIDFEHTDQSKRM